MLAFNNPILLRGVDTRMLKYGAIGIQKIAHGEELSTIVSAQDFYGFVELSFDPREK